MYILQHVWFVIICHFFYIRSPLTPDLSTDEFPDDIHNDIHDISHELELNQEDFSDVLPRLPDDMQDFDLFEGAVNYSSLSYDLMLILISLVFTSG